MHAPSPAPSAHPSKRLSICVFCGAASGHDSRYAELAVATGAAIAFAGWSLVYGGGNTGLMGEIAQSALREGGEVIGIMPSLLVERERALHSISRLEVVPDMASRKQRMIELSDAFVVLPGGLGTLDELFEALTWYQLGLQGKFCWILNQDGFYDPLIAQLEAMRAAGFIHGDVLPLRVVGTPAELISSITAQANATT
ncbi:MAG: TIGR00730 family Rossman fold protein [Candidatus Melainabacteria bacterium HGW-Melainabacteria-1]|nr:MAG: TIGR00730 family Rossman fold protein [Candidatus Melainabacteria bacterium HGW-Melainabacteria-1]